MKIFLTSATGYVGAAVAQCLRGRGHAVMGLARSARSVARLCRDGIQPVPGDLAQPESYRAAVASADAVVHTAFEYSAAGAENFALDVAATRALLSARRLIYTSNAYRPSARLEAEHCVLADESSASNAVIRLGMVYGGHGGGTICALFAAARRSGRLACPAAVVGNRWSLVHLDDMALLYATVVEAPASGVFHAVDGRPLTVGRVLECVGEACRVPLALQDEAITREQLESHCVDVMKLDIALDSPCGRALGWSPRYRDFAAGVADAHRDWSARELQSP